MVIIIIIYNKYFLIILNFFGLNVECRNIMSADGLTRCAAWMILLSIEYIGLSYKVSNMIILLKNVFENFFEDVDADGLG